MAGTADGSHKLYFEIFQETSSGDFGIQIPQGPLLRCHTHVLEKVGGFIGKVRQFGKVLPRAVVDNDALPTSKAFFKDKEYVRLLQDVDFVNFSLPAEKSTLDNPAGKLLQREDPLRPGYTTAKFISGTTGAIRRRDPFFLAERYQVECDCERMVELLRFVYQGSMSLFDLKPTTDREKAILNQKMLHVCLDAERFSVDDLFDKLLNWFGQQCFNIVGERNFADAFYKMQHFEKHCTEKHSRQALRDTVTGDMLARRDQFRAVTLDNRWTTLPMEFVQTVLSYDGMPIGNETEVLNLIKRWNGNTDKPPHTMVKLLSCFRVDEENKNNLVMWLTGLGWLRTDGEVAQDAPERQMVQNIIAGLTTVGKKPRRNLRGSELLEAERELQADASEDQKDPDAENVFLQYADDKLLSKGYSFSLRSQQRIIQADAIHKAGERRLQVLLSSPKPLWDPEHEVFVGLSYGQGRYFGYLCSSTAFSGIFSVKAFASAAPKPNQPVHLTGSGSKMEFDLALEVQYQRVNLSVTCKLSVIFGLKILTQEYFQLSAKTLRDGPGLRFQVVATGLGEESVDVQLGWTGGGRDDEAEMEVPHNIEFMD